MDNVQQIKLHQTHFKLLQELMEYHQYKQGYYSKHGYYGIMCPYCAGAADLRHDHYYCYHCRNIVDYEYWYTQSGIIWMFNRNIKI